MSEQSDKDFVEAITKFRKEHKDPYKAFQNMVNADRLREQNEALLAQVEELRTFIAEYAERIEQETIDRCANKAWFGNGSNAYTAIKNLPRKYQPSTKADNQ